MTFFAQSFSPEIVGSLTSGGIGVIRTDTIYGLVAQANDQRAVEKIYKVKSRSLDKSCIVLIASINQLFDSYDPQVIARLERLWPGKNSIILPSETAPEWLARDNHSVAYRLPNDESLRALIEQTGPLVAPSANPEGLAPALSIEAAKRYFGDTVDFYVDGGEVNDDTPSRLYRMWPERLERLR